MASNLRNDPIEGVVVFYFGPLKETLRRTKDGHADGANVERTSFQVYVRLIEYGPEGLLL